MVVGLFDQEVTWQGIVGAVAAAAVVLTVLWLIREILYGGQPPWE